MILAPHGRDALVAEGLLKEAGVDPLICADLAILHSELGHDISLAIVTEETMFDADLRGIAAWIDKQPSWSDLPFIVLTRRGGGSDRNPEAIRLAEVLGNVTYLERPFRPTTFISVVKAALKARQRQYEARVRIDELHESEARLRNALLAGRLGSWELDLGTSRLTASSTFKMLFGRAADEPFSYEDMILSVHPEDRARIQDAIRTSVESGRDYEMEYRNIWSDGSLHWAEARARVVDDGLGNKLQLVGVALDITSRKVAEANLLRVNEMLEERVYERTTELRDAHEKVLAEIQQRERAEDQLRQAQKMEMIGQLTGGVAHDFNNLLMVVLSNLSLLRKYLPATDARITRLIDGATLGAQRGAALTQRLLAFARRQDLRVEGKNIIGLVNGMSDLLQRSVGSQVELRFEMPRTLPPALVDANQLELALLNLVVNARDAMPEGGTLTISADCLEVQDEADLSDGRYVRLIVRDTGQGMDEATLKKATEPFFSTKGIGKGTGLGLSMIHGLALQLNGALRLSSELGSGTKAELWLPVTTASTRTQKTATKELAADESPALTILLVDDDALVVTSTVSMLEDFGHDVIEAESGATALDILQDGRPVDLLITDYSMPKMNGAQLATAARKLRPDLPILLVSGYAELPQGSDLKLPRLGKPYQPEQLAAEITKVMKSAMA
ncbi:MAG: hybrid sensor histidine kinase/response regulator [Rhodospirillales bacterium]|nr:hybrid sensor histidine kinase/response regulator [Rhodospirillales bacterium]